MEPSLRSWVYCRRPILVPGAEYNYGVPQIDPQKHIGLYLAPFGRDSASGFGSLG